MPNSGDTVALSLLFRVDVFRGLSVRFKFKRLYVSAEEAIAEASRLNAGSSLESDGYLSVYYTAAIPLNSDAGRPEDETIPSDYPEGYCKVWIVFSQDSRDGHGLERRLERVYFARAAAEKAVDALQSASSCHHYTYAARITTSDAHLFCRALEGC